MRSKLIIALDVRSADSIEGVVRSLPAEVSLYKVGLELFVADGATALATLRGHGKRVFLDLKLHDIPRTVARAVAAAARHDADLLTVHAAGGRAMLMEAAKAARDAGAHRPRLLAVTTLTSLDQTDLTELGIARPLTEHTLAMGRLAIDCGIDGLVCSPLEAAAFRAALGPAPILVTPGIRPSGAAVGDQKRVATPADALRAGASFLVVGRPILDAPDPAAAARAMLDEMAQAEA